MIVKYARFALLVALFAATLSCGRSDAVGVNERDLVLELLVFTKHGTHSTYVYYGDEGFLKDTTIDYWSSTRIFAGDESNAQPSHRFYEAGLDVLQCPEVVSIAKQLEVDTADISFRGSTCNQQRGLISYIVRILGTFPDYEEEVRGSRIKGTMQTSIMDVIVIYNDNTGSWQFVDSLTVDPFAERPGFYAFDRATIDYGGANCYYRKRDHILRYNLQDGIIDTLPECDRVGVPSNSMRLLTLSTTKGVLSLYDEQGMAIASTQSDVGNFVDVAAVNDDAFIISGWRYGLFGISMKYVVQLVDFSADKTEELFDVNGGVEFLSVKVHGR